MLNLVMLLRQKMVSVIFTQDGLDNLKVAQAVLDIMKGSGQAFRKRREKYDM